MLIRTSNNFVWDEFENELLSCQSLSNSNILPRLEDINLMICCLTEDDVDIFLNKYLITFYMQHKQIKIKLVLLCVDWKEKYTYYYQSYIGDKCTPYTLRITNRYPTLYTIQIKASMVT
jgi:hypothetical protein